MSKDMTAEVRVVRPAHVVWEEASRGPEEVEPAGEESTAFARGGFSTGFWRRDQQNRRFERPYDEIAYIIDGEVELTLDDGLVVHAGPGDVLVTPKGSKGFWRNLTPVTKFWAILEG